MQYRNAGMVVGFVLTMTPLMAQEPTLQPPIEPEVTAAQAKLPPLMRCSAEQTGGFHDYPDDDERYIPALFRPGSFALEENELFMLNLDPGTGGVDLYLIMRDQDDVESELQCRQVLGADNALGYSCVNTPPSEMLLINGETLRFTRTAVGGWAFSGATESASGDSIFVEYGACVAAPE